MTRRRVATIVVSVLGLSILMLAVGAVAGGVRQPDDPVAATSTNPAPQQPGALMVGADVAASIRALQTRLSSVPQDWSAWASLGGLYTTQARLTWRPGRETERPWRQSTRGVPRRGFLGAAQ